MISLVYRIMAWSRGKCHLGGVTYETLPSTPGQQGYCVVEKEISITPQKDLPGLG